MKTGRHPDCAAGGAPTIIQEGALIDDQMRECVKCGMSCRWDMVDNSFFGFESGCIDEIEKKDSPKYQNISCSQCGQEFGPGDRGFSSCDNHAGLVSDDILDEITTAVITTTETK
jgi:hypothetical protein